MKIVTLKQENLKEAAELAHQNYQEEKVADNILTEITEIPDLTYFTENNFGVAAMEGEKLLGFIGCCNPWDGAFDSNAKGTFTPIHAHGCVKENRVRIYGMMYQKMAEVLVSHGVLYHGIALYAHDAEAITAYFHNGFGHRCSDAIRRMELIPDIKPAEGISFAELPVDEAETFVAELPMVKNICGAFCMPEYRGRQIYQNLLNYVITRLGAEGYQYLGVDYESFNPTAQQFWTKYFEPYTCSVTRRIDEGVLKK